MKIAPDEMLLTGRWAMSGGHVIADDTSRRIDALIRHHLKELGRDATGWYALYLDPDDARLWELSYPDGGDHGGGAPQLRFVAIGEARVRFPGVQIED